MLKEIDTWQVIKLFQGQLPSLTTQSHERAAKATAVTGASPCLRTDHAHIQTLMRNEPAVAFTGPSGISQPSKAPALQTAKPGTPVLTLWHSPHWMSHQQSEHRTHSFSHLYIFIQHLSSWHGSVSILTFKPLWHSTDKIHSLGLISTRIHHHVWSQHCKILYTQGIFFS